MHQPRGNFIDGRWTQPSGDGVVRSINPATDGQVVFEAVSEPGHAADAMTAASLAQPSWARLPAAARLEALSRFARELEVRREAIAQGITAEMGKTLREARVEARSVAAWIGNVANHQLPRVQTWTAPGITGECRYQPLGVVAVLGPFNFPLHLVHAQVAPALATGNAVVIKPSERTPWSAQLYMEAWEAAGMPPVLQMVQGGASVGKALLEAPELRGVAFTGSWQTGHAIERSLHDRPEVLVALEMGGQNMSVVLDDAHLDQALEGVLLGGFLTTGQRCTCTSRVLVQAGVADELVSRLVEAARHLSWGDPTTDVFMGPLASVSDRDQVDTLCAAGRSAGAEVLLEAERREGGAWRGPSVHRVEPDHDSAYTREEVFGPDLAVTIVGDLEEALSLVNASSYGLSGSIFTKRREAFERFYEGSPIGCVNWNRSTNRASFSLPFGGRGRSGNFRSAGVDAVRHSTFPVQVQWNELGVLENEPRVRDAMVAGGWAPPEGEPNMNNALTTLETLHRLEEVCEPYGIYPHLDGSGVLRIPVLQLEPDGGDVLTGALLTELGGDARLEEGALCWTPVDGLCGAATLERALHHIRPIHPARFLGRRGEGCAVPAGDALTLPRSTAMLERLVSGDFMPADKKPTVLDLFRSSGPYLASVDDDPLVLFDAAAQIATHAGGLNPPEILEAYWTGGFANRPLLNPDTRGDWPPELTELAATLRQGAGGLLPHVVFAGSGAHANEIALGAAAGMRPGRNAIVAFEGGFHGRTMLALHTTWNPAKRERFELDGFRARWVPWPTWDRSGAEPPTGDLAGWDRVAEGPRPLPDGADDLLAAEWASLSAVEQAFTDDGAVAILVEPMQSEGGERYMTERFAARLRALATAYGIPFIVDEVQTGFGLGGPFFWHRRWDLPSPPDLVTVAKKAQLGAVLSTGPLGDGAEAHVVSAVRGSLQAAIMAEGDPDQMEATVRTRLNALAEAHPATVLAPRITAFAFGFDLPDPASVQAVIGERLWRGYMLYGAGSRALRFRLHPHITNAALDALFDRLDASLKALESGETRSWGRAEPTDAAPSWPPRRATVAAGYELRQISGDDWSDVQDAIAALQEASYEPARRDNLAELGALLQDRDSIYLQLRHVATGELMGTAFAYPLEHASQLPGPDTDPMLGKGNTLYSADVTVHPDHRGHGLGLALKEEQIRRAMRQTRPDGQPRYAFMTGRNKVGATAAMQELNRRFGAWTVGRLRGQYGQTDGESLYYRIPLTAPRLPDVARPDGRQTAALDLAQGAHHPLGDTLDGNGETHELVTPYMRGAMAGAVVNKLSLCNFVTPGVVRSVELLRSLAPTGMKHLVMANSREEICDKGLRSIKFHRGQASRVLSIGPVDAGTTTTAARSISLPAEHPDNWFGWPTTADPTLDPDQAIADLEASLTDGGAERVLAAVIEPVYSRTGRSVPESFWLRLRSALDAHGVPLIHLEHTTGGYRSGAGMWRSDSLPVQPDAVWWYPGGQLGLIYVNDALYVPDKLTLISTWGGDEVSLARLSWTLRAARRLPIAETSRALARTLQTLGTVHGEGLFRVVQTEEAELWQERLADAGVQVGRQGVDLLRFVPPLNLREADLDRLHAAIERWR